MADKPRKSEEVYRWLRLHVEQNKFSDHLKLPSENMICRKFGVSRTTVRESIQLLVEEGLIYTLRGSGTYINQVMVAPLEYGDNSKIKIGAILQGQDKGAIQDLLEGIRHEVENQEAGLYIYYTDNNFSNERYCLETVTTQKFSGFIVDGVKSVITNPNLDCYQRLLAEKIPVIFYNNYYPSLPYPRVTIDNKSTAKQLLSQLVRAGHRQIVSVFWCDNQQSLDKFEGFSQALQGFSLPFRDQDFYWCLSHQGIGKEFQQNFLRFLRARSKTTAIVCCNYLVYVAVKEVIARMGKQIPQDYSVVCFDYSEKNWESDGVTCSLLPAYEMGMVSAGNLLTMIKNKDCCGSRYHYQFDPIIYEGRSVEKQNPHKKGMK